MNSKSGIRCLDEDSRQVELPNGRKIELASREGADDLVDTVGTDFISTNLTATDHEELMFAYVIIVTVAETASPLKIASGIPESELRTFIEHTRNTLKTLSTDRNWLRSGALRRHHELLLQAVASFSRHPSFLKIFLSSEGMEAVAKFYASRKKNDTPSQCVARSIVMVVHNAIFVLTQEGAGEKAFGTIEKTGLLGQFIRCVPADTEFSAHIVTSLQSCLQLVKKKLKSGTRTGDILDAVIAGKDGPINEKAKSSLAKLQSLARLSNDNYDSKYANLKMCRHCDKDETQMDGAKLMTCQRCKSVYYCSRECQVADWKSHKQICNHLDSGNESRSAFKTYNTAMWAFVKSNYFDIAKEVYKKTQEYNVPKKELLVEIDFCEDAPALRNGFKVWLTSGFMEGSSVGDAPDWFHVDAGGEKTVREAYAQVTSDDLLAVCRAGNGMVTFQILTFRLPNASHECLSDEAVEAIGREDYIRMVACLGQLVTHKYFEKRSGLT
jgi:hypothetical protein